MSCNVHANGAAEASHPVSIGLWHLPQPNYECMLPFFILRGRLYVVALLVSCIAHGKQKRLREVVRIRGLRTWVYWARWGGPR